MRKINYPLIVSDFDGTLVSGDASITEKNKRAIASYVAAGGVFAISTGRLPSGILPRAKELGLQGVVCCCQGSIIVDIQSEEMLLEGRMSYESTLAVCKKMEALGLHIHAYDTWEYYSNVDDEYLHLYEKITGAKAIVVDEQPLSSFIEEKGFQACKLLAMVEEERAAELIALLQAENFEGCEITQSAKFLIEIIQKKYSKGTAVEFLAKRYGVPLEKTIAVGDQQNDVPMLERAGLGIAVANANEKLKACAKIVWEKTNEESAIAEIIEKYGFYEEK